MAPPPDYPRFPRSPRQGDERIDHLFALQRQADPFGTRLHLFFAAAHCFLAGFPTTFVEWSGLPLLLVFVVRLFTHHRVIGPLFWDPIARLALAWAAWVAASRLWTAGSPADWLADAQHLRFGLLVALLYPVLDRRPVLIAALGLGLLCGQLSQAVHLVGVRADLPALVMWNRDPSRLSGWWDPVVGGSLLCAALGLFLPVAARGLRERGVRGWLAVVPVATTLAGIAIIGTRGAWIAAVLLLMFAAAGALWVQRRWWRDRWGRLLAAGAVLAAVLVIAAAVAPGIRDRFDAGVREVRRAIDGDYRSDTGRRIAMWRWACDEFAAHPVRGVGAGGYKPWADATLETQRAERREARRSGQPHASLPRLLPPPHAHAHSWPMHTLATLGLIGAAIMVVLVAAAFRSTLGRGARALAMPSADRAQQARRMRLLSLSTDAGPPLALAGLTLAGLFDTIHINQQTANVLFILLALCVRFRPRVV